MARGDQPISGRLGVHRVKPLQAMREHVEAIRQLFTMEEVTYQGDFVKLDRVKLDVVFGDTRPRDIPIDIGATGDKMLELTGEICDGVVLNYVVSVDYIRRAVELVAKGAAKAGKSIDQIDRPELLVCSMSDNDPQAAMFEAKKLVAYYLATEPHIMKASGVPDDLIARVQAVMGWPARCVCAPAWCWVRMRQRSMPACMPRRGVCGRWHKGERWVD